MNGERHQNRSCRYTRGLPKHQNHVENPTDLFSFSSLLTGFLLRDLFYFVQILPAPFYPLVLENLLRNLSSPPQVKDFYRLVFWFRPFSLASLVFFCTGVRRSQAL